MTDLPRRSYPLVVPPPGGFEEAVKRGRGIRRRRAGGSTGAALVLMGALAYSTMGGPNGTSGLQPTRDLNQAESTEGPGAPSHSPEPSVTPTDTAPTASTAPGVGDPGPQTDPSGIPYPTVGVPPHRPPGGTTGRPYAARAAITEGQPMRSANTFCLERATDPWCSYAMVQPQQGVVTVYTLSFVLCRGVDSNVGVVSFDSKDEVEFVATMTAKNEDVWTYSRGRAVRFSEEETQIGAGECVEWKTEWDGYDDWGYNPDAGDYKLTARSTGHSTDPLPDAEYLFTHL